MIYKIDKGSIYFIFGGNNLTDITSTIFSTKIRECTNSKRFSDNDF
jgi:hypothetical protein